MNCRKFLSKNDYLNFVENKFIECFNDKNYQIDKSVNITSQIDKTVDFIGSKISPLKHYIEENNIPVNGVALIQNCMKVRALKHLKDEIPQIFGSCYRGMGTLTTYNLEKIVNDTFDYFLNDKYLGMNPSDLCIRLNSDDRDLINATENIDRRVHREFDTETIENYKHIYGMNDITGRNLNIAMRKGNTNKFHDCSAIIIMENQYRKISIDMGIGNSTLSMCYFNTDNTVSSSRMGDILQINDVYTMKLADSIIAVTALLRENITEHPSKHFRKKFRQYLNALYYWKEKLELSDYEIINCASKYYIIEYKEELSEKSIAKILKLK